MNQRNKLAQLIRGIILEGTGIAVLIFLFLTLQARADEPQPTPSTPTMQHAVVMDSPQTPETRLLDRMKEIFSIGDAPYYNQPVPITRPTWATLNDAGTVHRW